MALKIKATVVVSVQDHASVRIATEAVAVQHPDTVSALAKESVSTEIANVIVTAVVVITAIAVATEKVIAKVENVRVVATVLVQEIVVLAAQVVAITIEKKGKKQTQKKNVAKSILTSKTNWKTFYFFTLAIADRHVHVINLQTLSSNQPVTHPSVTTTTNAIDRRTEIVTEIAIVNASTDPDIRAYAHAHTYSFKIENRKFTTTNTNIQSTR